MKSTKFTRRAFLEGTAAAALATQFKPARAQSKISEAYPENGTLIPDEGWHLWLDHKAEWKNDEIFLPEDITQDADGVIRGKGKPLPVNVPTGGWEATSVAASKEVNDNPFNNYGKIDKSQVNARIYQPLGDGDDFISISGHYNENRNNFFGSVPLRLDTTQTNAAGSAPRVVGPGSANRFPLDNDEREYNPTCASYRRTRCGRLSPR